MSNEVAKRESAEVASTDYAEYEDAGFENQTTEDIQIPFLALVQDDSKVVNEGLAESGSLYNTVTEEDLGREATFVGAYVEKCFVEWIPRKKGGGFVGRHETDSQIVADAKERSDEFAKYKTESGNDLVETIYVYGALCNGDDIQPIVIAFTSSKIKVYRKWNTCVTMYRHEESDGRRIRLPRFAHLVNVGVVKDRNKAGMEFWNLSLTPANGSIKDSILRKDDPRFIAAMGFGELVKSGRARAAEESLNKTTVEETDNY